MKGLTDFTMGMLETSTGLLKALRDKILLSSRGSGMAMASSRSANLISSPMMSSRGADSWRIWFWFWD